MNEELQTMDNTTSEVVTIAELSQVINSDLVKKAAKIIRAVNHPLRQSMISLINEKQSVNVTDIYIKLRIEQSVASQHLRILRSSQVVKTQREGKQIFYSLNNERISQITECAEMLTTTKQ